LGVGGFGGLVPVDIPVVGRVLLWGVGVLCAGLVPVVA